MSEEEDVQIVHLTVHGTEDTAWSSYRRIAVGGPDWQEADAWVDVQDVEPPLLIEIHGTGGVSVFSDAILWLGWIVIGMDTHVHFISPSGGQVTTFPLGDSAFAYFGRFYPYPDFLLVTSGVALYCFDCAARLVWQSHPLAVDGVLVERVEDGVIYGQGEQDPPGGWTPFTISLETGTSPNSTS